MHGKRETHKIEVSIFDKVELLIEKLSEIYVNVNLFHKDREKKDMTRKSY